MNNKVERFRKSLKENNLNSAIVFKPENRRYLSGFTGTSGYVVITEDKNLFITDFRYTKQASDQCKDFEIVQHTNDRTLYDILNELGLKNMGFEDAFVTVSQYNEFNEKLVGIELKPLKGTLGKLRTIKEQDEIDEIRKAAEIADKAFEYICGVIKPGITEWEVALELESFMKKKGATATSFDSIVASGIRSSMPHGVASHKVIEDGDFVTLDFGCVYNGYCSDMTRTIVVGKASEKQKEIYNVVLEAQEAALKAIKPGITGYDADKVARDIITEKGYGEYFGHGLGHGVGLEVHESPRLSPLGKDVLEPNMVVTDEPGVYLPDFAGVRIEDLIVVTENGCERLSKSPKHLIEL
ncbi:Xaa-Pro peptidase family protein [Wukongibacter baidiensis]|uniref:M24 family metallopeptidase n=1 Tax=Wukongibacter baidiensis TaxID=1723361 RepID=UPI003D7FD7BE